MTEPSPVRVLVVDDSATVRAALRELLGRRPGIGEVETASDGEVALRKLDRFDPDVVTLDVEMPGLDGLATLRRIMATHPRPVIMLSAHTAAGADRTIRALSLGAVDFVQKPAGRGTPALGEVVGDLAARIVAVGRRHRARPLPGPLPLQQRAVLPRAAATAASTRISSLIAVGASTGGPEAIHRLLAGLPATLPAAVLVVQHMPADFTGAFARRLNDVCSLEVKEAEDGDGLHAGRALVAPGHSHLTVRRDGPLLRATVEAGPPVNGHRPSVDALFHSVAALSGLRLSGVLLTGMGRDGAEGLRELHGRGAFTCAQDEASSVVYGMPRAAVELECVDLVADPARIAESLVAGHPSPPALATHTAQPLWRNR